MRASHSIISAGMLGCLGMQASGIPSFRPIFMRWRPFWPQICRPIPVAETTRRLDGRLLGPLVLRQITRTDGRSDGTIQTATVFNN